MRDSALGWTVWPSGRSDSKHISFSVLFEEDLDLNLHESWRAQTCGDALERKKQQQQEQEQEDTSAPQAPATHRSHLTRLPAAYHSSSFSQFEIFFCIFCVTSFVL